MKYINKLSLPRTIILICVISILSFFSYLNYSLNKNIYNYENFFFQVNSGESVSKVINKLKEKGLIDSDLRIKIISYIYNIKPRFIIGKYLVEKNETENTLLRKLLTGQVIQNFITIIEGSTYKEILLTLKDSKLIKFNKNINYSEKIFPSKIKFVTPEGTCFPDTYKFSSGISVDKFLSKCSRNMEDILMKYWKVRDYSLPYKTPYEMLIMASIIEKETSDFYEKPIVASVFINRLNKKMRLQADPTVIYGIKNFNGDITKKDLMANNEYNTYRINGLPKTPICSPGERSIEAASKPAISDYLYFVANNKGKHVFSTNYKDHVKAVNKYQK